MSEFVPRQTYEEKPATTVAKAEIQKAFSGGKAWPGEAELKVRIDHPTTDGSVKELAARITAFVRNLNDRERGGAAICRAEREAARDASLAFLASSGVTLTPAVRELIDRLVGLDPWTATENPQDTSAPLGESANDPMMADLRQKIATLREQVSKMTGQIGEITSGAIRTHTSARTCRAGRRTASVQKSDGFVAAITARPKQEYVEQEEGENGNDIGKMQNL
jgi:hypothetical protein